MRIWIIRFSLAVVFAGFALYSYLMEQNKCTELNMRLPKIVKEIEMMHQRNAELEYQIVCFESPDHLLQLSKHHAYSHLKFPVLNEVLLVKEEHAASAIASAEKKGVSRHKTAIVVGAK